MEKTRLLLVDDEQSILKALTRTLSDMNLDIALAGSGPSALSLLEKREFDLVLTDQRMPVMTGVEFLDRAQRRDSRLICMIMTAYSDIQVAIRAINDIGIFKFIVKPWEEYDLRMTVEKAKRLAAMMKSDQLFCETLMEPSEKMAAAGVRWQSTDASAASDEPSALIPKGWQDINTYIAGVNAMPMSEIKMEAIFKTQTEEIRKKIKAEVIEGLYDKDWCRQIGVDYENPSHKDMVVLYKFIMHRFGLIYL